MLQQLLLRLKEREIDSEEDATEGNRSKGLKSEKEEEEEGDEAVGGVFEEEGKLIKKPGNCRSGRLRASEGIGFWFDGS